MNATMNESTQPVKMINVGGKAMTLRTAVASGQLTVQSETLERIRSSTLVKGDALQTARIAGIMAAKRTSEFVPLCHSLPLEGVDVDIECVSGTGGSQSMVLVIVRVVTTAKTGVEMEALTAVTASLMTLYDMAKSIDPDMVISEIKLDTKTGGSSGDYVRSGAPAVSPE
jgi:cyclic pyranopterin phosphate synthase